MFSTTPVGEETAGMESKYSGRGDKWNWGAGEMSGIGVHDVKFKKK